MHLKSPVNSEFTNHRLLNAISWNKFHTSGLEGTTSTIRPHIRTRTAESLDERKILMIGIYMKQ